MAWVRTTDLIYENNVDPGVLDNFAAGFKYGDDARNTVSGETFTCVGDGIWGSLSEAVKRAGKNRMFSVTIGPDRGFAQSTSTAYAAMGSFFFPGTDAIGLIKKITAILWRQNSISVDLRIYDVTNAQVIAEINGVTDAVPTAQDLGTISNLPTSGALFEIQGLRTGNLPGQDRVRCAGLTFEY